MLKLIGEELISDEVVALAELVKNSHDADATTVSIRFEGVTDDSGEIIIADDGSGMDLEALLERWMQPAGSTKSRERTTRKGRRVLGEKGVGRFAVDKLARHLELASQCQGSEDKLQAYFDWDAFDDEHRMLSTIKCKWELIPDSSRKSHGMVLHLRGVRTRWTERMFRRLSLRLSRLLSPFRGQHDFRILLQSDEFPDYSGDLRSEILDGAPHGIDASFDGVSTVRICSKDGSPFDQPWNGPGNLSCGPVRIRLFAFDLEGEALARLGPRLEVRAWLREWTGISIYRDGFRLWPYGEPHDDWLRLDQRRVNVPVVRLSNNQIVGFVEILRDRNPQLTDQTNREGLVNNRAFQDLRRLMYHVLQILESERQRVRRKVQADMARSANGTPHNGQEEITELLRKIAAGESGQLAHNLNLAEQRINEAFKRKDQEIQHRLEGYSEVAGIGQVLVGFSPSVRPLLDDLRSESKKLKAETSGNGHGALGILADRIDNLSMILETRLGLVGSMTTQGQRRRRKIDVVAELKAFQRQAMPELATRNTRMEVIIPVEELIRVEMNPASLHRILYILTVNSLDWIDNSESPRIRIRARRKDTRCELVFSDNGPGITPEIAPHIFEPLYSLKDRGNGMGLTIARDILSLYGGTIEVITDRRRRGANLRVQLPLTRNVSPSTRGRSSSA